ncbi:MAG: anhydro-N-acetylmuramic acid kinase [Bacteroidetes bacterium]|nr:MAG: anhydro-N-acetylmuramic acid kinase [Bacteroidota bacterium]
MTALHILGLMSGTSLDGLDMALCRFYKENGAWRYEVLASACEDYPAALKNKLSQLPAAGGEELARAHAEYGLYLGQAINRFRKTNSLRIDLVSSHGHTVFHQPENGFTFQLGSGAAIAATCGIDTICDFRTTDVALGGQGAPLVPVGDELLFGDYDYCLNIGGIANISYHENGKRVAFDVCPANIVLNGLSELLGKPYDDCGRFAQAGKTDKKLLEKLDALDYYHTAPPKSIGREWVDAVVFPLLRSSGLSVHDQLRTFTEHIAAQIMRSCIHPVIKKGMLVTGGGAFNTFLVDRLNAGKPELHIAAGKPETVKFKEAIIFAFLGLLRHQHEPNALSSVTGASRNSIGGCIYSGK